MPQDRAERDRRLKVKRRNQVLSDPTVWGKAMLAFRLGRESKVNKKLGLTKADIIKAAEHYGIKRFIQRGLFDGLR